MRSPRPLSDESDPDILGPRYAALVRTRAYLNELPNGLASYPQCRSKTQVWSNILRWTDTSSLVGRVPKHMPVFATSPAHGGNWISAVHSFAAHLTLRDTLFQSDSAICHHFRNLNHELYSAPVFKVMLALATPILAVRAADRLFGAMFQGFTLRARSELNGHTQLSLDYPPRLVPALVGRLFLVAFEVGIALAGGKRVEGAVLAHGETTAKYEITWC